MDGVLDQLEAGVPGMPKLTDATDVLMSGDSGGANGVRQNIDRMAQRLRSRNPNVRVRANLDATFHVDPSGLGGLAPDPKDPFTMDESAKYNISLAVHSPRLDESCVAGNTGPRAFLCHVGAYVERNHLTTPFFQRQDMLDPKIGESSPDNYTPVQLGQLVYDELVALPNLRNTAVERASIAFTPGVAGSLCGQHVVWADNDGFFGKRIRASANSPAYSYYELLWNWLQGGSPTAVIEPRMPSPPEKAAKDSICDAKAPSAPPPPTIATLSSASYRAGDQVAPESIVATFGSNLAATTAVTTTIPWPTQLGGVRVTVTDGRGAARDAPLYYVSPPQLLYLIPAGTAPGMAQIAIGAVRTSVAVAAVAPGIYTANQAGTGVAAATYIRVNSRGVRSEGFLFDPASREAVGVPVQPGDQVYLILYGTGLRGASTATATINDVSVPVTGPVAHSQYPGLDQINLGPLSGRVGLGEKEIHIRASELLANPVTVKLQGP